MGLTITALEFILRGCARETPLKKTLTVGRQAVVMNPKQTVMLLRKHGYDGQGLQISERGEYYAERLLEAIGATQVDSLDYSPFEGATVVQDLNSPLAETLKEQWDTVIDGGTIEHVFNFPRAIQSYMELIRPKGSLYIFTPANNFFGHGLYQFSAELFWRIFVPENGFKISQMVLAEEELFGGEVLPGLHLNLILAGKAYKVIDPAVARSRVELVNKRQTVIMIHAIKTETVPLFRTPPLQSDYVATWSGEENGPKQGTSSSTLVSWMNRVFAKVVRRANRYSFFQPAVRKISAIGYRYCPTACSRRRSLRNEKFFQPWDMPNK